MPLVPGACVDRKWLSVGATPENESGASERTFTVMSYNILCQKLIRRSLFPYASSKSLKWKSRKEKLLKEISHWKADILCLQEVGIEHWHQIYAPHFRQAGYDSRMFFSMQKSHGIAILWKRAKFHMVGEQTVNMDDSICVDGERLITDNVGLVVVLRFGSEVARVESVDPYADSVDPEYRISAGGASTAVPGPPGVIVTNTHLYWKPGACYERLQQQIAMLAAQRSIQEKHPDYPVIFCGDFNTTPDDAGYALLTKARPVVLNEWQLDNLLPVTMEDDEEEDEEENDDAEDSTSGSVSTTSYAAVTSAGTLAESEDLVAKRRRLEEYERKAEADLARDQERVRRLVSLLQMENPILLRSCYSTYAELDPTYATKQWPGEPIYTNYAKWSGTLDYIFYAPTRGLAVRDVLSLPAEQRMKPGLPNETFASDHVALAARFGLTSL
ncbi:RNA exonuclease ngl2 [Coemansia thaxteri]|nr:RNA exonuclease ngl2 [Coemansia thaxteri]